MDSKTDRFQRIEAVFHEALAVSGDARVELIDAQCGGDRKLAAEVRMLLAASAKEEQRTASLLSEREQGKAAESVGRRIGPYVVDGLLGRGADETLLPPDALPPPRPIAADDARLIARATGRARSFR